MELGKISQASAGLVAPKLTQLAPNSAVITGFRVLSALYFRQNDPCKYAICL